MHSKKLGIVSGKGIPIKKIYVDDGKIIMDVKTIDRYGFTQMPDPLKNVLQKKLDMPIDTNPSINLPEKLVASASPKPYVTIFGFIKTSNGTEPTTVTLTTKTAQAELVISEFEEKYRSANTPFNINKTDYFIDSDSLYECYVRNKIIQNGNLSSTLFNKIAKEFFTLFKNKTFDGKSTSFTLYILPNDKDIKFSPPKSEPTATFTDSFGNECTQYSDKPTQGVNFLSFDDKAFTINGKQKQDFYQNLGIGKESTSKIIMPSNNRIKIDDLEWYFIIIGSDLTFPNTSRGIYDQLYHNYQKLCDSQNNRVVLKVLCIKRSQAKMEVLIDENLTMPRLKSIFDIGNLKVEPFAYELLQIKHGTNITYKYYIQAIKALINQTPLNRDLLLSILTDRLRTNMHDFLTGKIRPEEFFKKAEFCMNTLKCLPANEDFMDKTKAFANHVGVMARLYINFRKGATTNNSIIKILAKPKYDIATLKQIIGVMDRGLHTETSKNETERATIIEQLDEFPTNFTEEDCRRDLSYYFYIGYFKWH